MTRGDAESTENEKAREWGSESFSPSGATCVSCLGVIVRIKRIFWLHRAMSPPVFRPNGVPYV